MKTSLKPGAMPRAKVADFDTALSLAATFGAKDSVKDGLRQLRDATAALDQARDTAQEAMAAATKRASEAREAEVAATRSRQALVDETEKARDALGQREVAMAERERLVTEAEQSQEARDTDLKRREDHLRKAGVRGF